MNILLILGLIIILIISLIYKVYKRKTIEGNTGILNNCDLSTKGKAEEEILIDNWTDVKQKSKNIIKYYENDNCNVEKNVQNKFNDARQDQDIAAKYGISTQQYYAKYPDDDKVDEGKATQLGHAQRQNQANYVETIEEQEKFKEKKKKYTARDFTDIACNTCNDIGDNCALYYNNGESELNVYYKDPWDLQTYRVFDEFNETNMKNDKGHLIKDENKCREIKKLEKCKNVNSCKDIRGSKENSDNCVICEKPVSNGTYSIQKEYPKEHETVTYEIKVQNGFPKDWKDKRYECKKDRGPFDLEGCERGACAEDYKLNGISNPGPKTPECYAELYKLNGGVGPPIEPEWWKNNETNIQPIKFNGYVEDSENEFTWKNPTSSYYKSIVYNILGMTNDKKEMYSRAKKAHVFKNGPVDENKIQDFACTHQERTGKPNIDCQLKKERDVELQTEADGSFIAQNYPMPFSNLREGYTCSDQIAIEQLGGISGKKITSYYKSFIADLSKNFNSLNYENILEKIANIKNMGRGDEKQAALKVFGDRGDMSKPQKGDHVQFELNNQTVRGVVVEIENKDIGGSEKTMALCIWDYYKGNNEEYYRRGYSVCNEENFKSKNQNKTYNNSDCIDGITSYFDTGSTNCVKENLSCKLSDHTTYGGNLGSYKSMGGSLMEKMLENSKYSDVEKKLWKDEGWIDINELERLHICQKQKCKKGYFSCENTTNNYINL